MISQPTKYRKPPISIATQTQAITNPIKDVREGTGNSRPNRVVIRRGGTRGVDGGIEQGLKITSPSATGVRVNS